MNKILTTVFCITIFAACAVKPQHIQDQTEAIIDPSEQISEELVVETINENPKDSLSAKK